MTSEFDDSKPQYDALEPLKDTYQRVRVSLMYHVQRDEIMRQWYKLLADEDLVDAYLQKKEIHRK